MSSVCVSAPLKAPKKKAAATPSVAPPSAPSAPVRPRGIRPKKRAPAAAKAPSQPLTPAAQRTKTKRRAHLNASGADQIIAQAEKITTEEVVAWASTLTDDEVRAVVGAGALAPAAKPTPAPAPVAEPEPAPAAEPEPSAVSASGELNPAFAAAFEAALNADA